VQPQQLQKQPPHANGQVVPSLAQHQHLRAAVLTERRRSHKLLLLLLSSRLLLLVLLVHSGGSLPQLLSGSLGAAASAPARSSSRLCWLCLCLQATVAGNGKPNEKQTQQHGCPW
jgi:hypothetical protein